MAPPRRTFDVSHKLLPSSSRVGVVPGRIGHPHVTTHDDGKTSPVRDRVCQRDAGGVNLAECAAITMDGVLDAGSIMATGEFVDGQHGLHARTRMSGLPASTLSRNPYRPLRYSQKPDWFPPLNSGQSATATALRMSRPGRTIERHSLLAAQCQRRRIAKNWHPMCVMLMMRSPRREVPP